MLCTLYAGICFVWYSMLLVTGIQLEKGSFDTGSTWYMTMKQHC